MTPEEEKNNFVDLCSASSDETEGPKKPHRAVAAVLRIFANF